MFQKEIMLKQLYLVLILIFLSGCSSAKYRELEGRWIGSSKDDPKIIMVFQKNNKISIKVKEFGEGTYILKGSSNPYNLDIDLDNHGKIATIIAINGNTLTLENNTPGMPRPLSFSEAAVTLTKQ